MKIIKLDKNRLNGADLPEEYYLPQWFLLCNPSQRMIDYGHVSHALKLHSLTTTRVEGQTVWGSRYIKYQSNHPFILVKFSSFLEYLQYAPNGG